MTNYKIGRILGILISTVLLSVFALCQPPGPPPGGPDGPGGPGGPRGGIERAFRSLNLSSAQREKIHSIHESERTASEPRMQQIHPLKEQMRTIIEAPTFDTAAAQALISQISRLESELALIHAQTESQIFNVLTADQKARLESLRKQGRPEPPPDGPPGI